MKVVNLMKHDCTIKVAGFERTFEPSGKVAEVEVSMERIGERFVGEGVDGLQVSIYRRTFGDVKNLPDPEPGTIYLVSSMVLDAVRERNDVFAPDSGPSAERNAAGHVVSVCRLIGN